LADGLRQVTLARAGTGRAELASLQRDARANTFLLIARKAAAARKETTTSSHGANSQRRSRTLRSNFDSTFQMPVVKIGFLTGS